MTGLKGIGFVAALAMIATIAACADDSATDVGAGSSTTAQVVEIPSCDKPDPACATEVDGLHLSVTGRPSEPLRVKPPPGDQLETIDRDAGIAARLRDGSVLWLFGDTAARNEDGSLVYFVISSAAWATPSAPTVTLDHNDPVTHKPTVFAHPTADMATCPLDTQQPGMWPASAIVEPVGDRDRVLIWFHAICLGNGDGSLVDMGMALGEWWYDPATPPTAAEPLRATILNQQLFPVRGFGTGSLAGNGGDNSVFTYSCVLPKDPADGQGYGPCSAATTTFARAADANSYQTIGEMEMPASKFSAPYPAGPFSVAYDPAVGGYVMVYSPWPGITSYVAVRVAANPSGPWSKPVTITLDGCADAIGDRQLNCYAANAQPSFSTPGRLGIGYYDSAISTFPTRGAYTVVTVPIEVFRDP